MNENVELRNIYNSIINTSNQSFSNVISTSETTFSKLISSLENILQNLSIPDTWDDDIKREINGSLKVGIDGMIEACKEPIGSVLIPISGKIDPLKVSLETYFEKVELYNEAVVNKEKIGALEAEPQKESFIDESYWDVAHRQWEAKKRNIEIYEQLIRDNKTASEKWEKDSIDRINEIKGLLGNFDARAAAIANGAGTSTAIVKETREEVTYDGRRKIVTVIKDENGNVIEENYQILNDDGSVAESGVIYLDADGNKSEKVYTQVLEDYTANTRFVYTATGEIIESTFDRTYNDGSTSSSHITYWETTFNMKTHDYVYTSEGYKLEAHSEYSEDGVQTERKHITTTESGTTMTDYTYDEQGREVCYVRNEFDTDGTLESSTLVTAHYDEDGTEVGYTYDTRYPDGSYSKSEWDYVPGEDGSVDNRITEKVAIDSNGNMTVSNYTYSEDSNNYTRKVTNVNPETSEVLGFEQYDYVVNSEGQQTGYTRTVYGPDGKSTGYYVREGIFEDGKEVGYTYTSYSPDGTETGSNTYIRE